MGEGDGGGVCWLLLWGGEDGVGQRWMPRSRSTSTLWWLNRGKGGRGDLKGV